MKQKERENGMSKLVKIVELKRKNDPDIVIGLSKGETLDYREDFYVVSKTRKYLRGKILVKLERDLKEIERNKGVIDA